MSQVEISGGVATITTIHRTVMVNLAATAHAAASGQDSRMSRTDLQALAAGYMMLDREVEKLKAELAAARSGKIGMDHAQAMQDVRGVLSHIATATERFLEVYDQGDAPDSGLDEALREKMGAAINWLVHDSSNVPERTKVLEGRAA